MKTLGRPAHPGDEQQNVEVGRLFPAMPNYMRVTVGKKSEMGSFLTAFRQVTA